MNWMRGIHWRKATTEEPNRVETLAQRVQNVIPGVALSVFFAFLFWLSSIWALADGYGVERPTVSQMILLTLLLFCVGMVQEILGYFWKYRGGVVVGMLSGIAVIAAGYSLLRRKELWDAVSEAYTVESVYFVLRLVFCVVLVLARSIPKTELLMLPPVVIEIVLLRDGTVASKGALFVLLAGMLLCRSLGWEAADMQPRLRRSMVNDKGKSIAWFVKGACISVACGVVLLAGAGIAQKTIEKHAEKVSAVASEITRKMNDLDIGNGVSVFNLLSGSAWRLFRDEALDVEVLDNHMLEYHQVEVLRVESSEKPIENIYLRGFCGDIYVNGSWQRDLDTLEQACLESDRDYDAVRAQIAFFTPRKLQEQYGQGGTVENANLRQIRVNYTGMVSEVAYYPYFAEVNSKGIGLAGDSGFTKGEKAERIVFLQWKVLEQDFREIDVPKNQWDFWYEDYVKTQYLTVPEGLESVEKIAVQIVTSLEEETDHLATAEAVAEWLAANTTYSLCPPVLEQGVDPIEYFLSTGKTGYCMHYAGAAAMLLRELGVPARYASGYLVEAEQFETVNGSDAVLAEKLQFEAVVLDDRAHAWVEIYLDTIGWVPVEVTPGYPIIEVTGELADKLHPQEIKHGGATLTGGSGVTEGAGSEGNGIGNDQGKEDEGGANGEIIGEIVQIGDTQEKPEDIKDSETEQGTQSGGTEEDTVGGTEDSDGEDAEDAEDFSEVEDDTDKQETPEEEKKIVMVTPPPTDEKEFVADTKTTTRKIIIYILGVLIVIGILVALVADTHKFFRKESVYYKQLRKEMKRGNHKRVIMMINSGIYRKLYFKRLLEDGRGDEAYERALKDNYKQLSEEEWDRYMTIVKQVAFSKAEFDEEDVKFCFDVYRDVVYKDEVW